MFKTLPSKIFYIFLLICLISASIYFYWQQKLPLISPINLIESNYLPQQTNKKVVYGFLPYWSLKYADTLQINHLTHLAYFGIDLQEDGKILKKVNSKELEPGWNKLNTKTTNNILFQSKLLHQKTVLTITAMKPKLIESIVNQEEHSQKAIVEILDTYKKFSFDGINVDFEYVGTPDDQTINNFTKFISNLKTSCQTVSPNCFIDIDVFGDSSNKKRLWDLENINKYVDHIIVMAYDYYRASSTKAGPVAPLTGSCRQNQNSNCIDEDILGHLSYFLKKVPAEKIVLGVPFYGYEWQTATTDFLSNTYPKSGSIATYQRVQKLITDPETSSISAKWSSSTLSPYIIYYDEEKIKQIHFENTQSLQLKIDVIKSTGIGGLAIWALGYEVPYQELWNTVSNINQK